MNEQKQLGKGPRRFDLHVARWDGIVERGIREPHGGPPCFFVAEELVSLSVAVVFALHIFGPGTTKYVHAGGIRVAYKLRRT